MKTGDKVRCLFNDIDGKIHGKGRVGHIEGFARLSKYHGREIRVVFDTGEAGWFWETSVKLCE